MVKGWGAAFTGQFEHFSWYSSGEKGREGERERETEVNSCLVLSLSCLVLSCLVLSCLVLSCLVLSCLIPSWSCHGKS
jgi:hypothetical protein